MKLLDLPEDIHSVITSLGCHKEFRSLSKYYFEKIPKEHCIYSYTGSFSINGLYPNSFELSIQFLRTFDRDALKKNKQIWLEKLTKFVNLIKLDCSYSQTETIPKLVKLKYLKCYETYVSEIPKVLVNLEFLDCARSKVTKIPKEFTKLIRCHCYRDNYIDETLNYSGYIPPEIEKNLMSVWEYNEIGSIKRKNISWEAKRERIKRLKGNKS